MGLVSLASFAGGAINSVAGGGTLLAFPAAMAAGLPPIVANATNSVAMTPASLASALAYRRELSASRRWLALLALPSAAGALLGAWLLVVTPERWFARLVPLLVLGATALLLWQNLRPEVARDAPTTPRHRALAVAVQLAIAVYGGYFGAGMGILMLAGFSLLDLGDLHQKNAVKSVLGAAINGVATASFIVSGKVDPTLAIAMGASATLGGFLGAAGARRVAPRTLRWLVIAIGVALSVALGARALG